MGAALATIEHDAHRADSHLDGWNVLGYMDRAPNFGEDVDASRCQGIAGLQLASPTLASPVTRTTFTYDAAGRVNGRADLIDGHTFTSQYADLVNDALDTVTYRRIPRFDRRDAW